MPVRNVPSQAAKASYTQTALALTNQARLKQGLPALRRNSQLDLAAQRHSAVMAKYGYVGHDEPKGTNSVLKRAEKAGYEPRYVAENVFGPSTSFDIIDHAILTPQAAVQSWIQSPGHRRNLMNPRFTEVGFGCVNGFWTQVLGEPDRFGEEPIQAKPIHRGPVKKPAPEPFNWVNL